jgi:hypothetical protein
LGYRHVEDFLRDQTSGELAGWLAYLLVDDEVQTQRMALAVNRAFVGGKTQSGRRVVDDDEDEEIIDTTKPEFAQHFKGFTNTLPQARQSVPQRRQMNTEILFG